MTHERLSEVMYKIKGDRAERSYLLVPDSTATELNLAETALGMSLPLTITSILDSWTEQGSEALLTTLPRILNPSATAHDLEPTGRSIREVFPAFCSMLDNTESFGIVLDPINYRKNNGELLFIGIGERLITRISRPMPEFWTTFEPKTLFDLAQWEMTSNIKLSPQMKQMLLRVDGTLSSAPPYFLPVEQLEKGLLSDLYKDFWTEMNSEESFERLETFIAICENGSGDEQGFFFDTLPPDGEYTIYEWDHEAVKFRVIAPDFASWLERVLNQIW